MPNIFVIKKRCKVKPDNKKLTKKIKKMDHKIPCKNKQQNTVFKIIVGCGWFGQVV